MGRFTLRGSVAFLSCWLVFGWSMPLHKKFEGAYASPREKANFFLQNFLHIIANEKTENFISLYRQCLPQPDG